MTAVSGPLELRSSLELACDPCAPRSARLHVRDVLRRWGVPPGVVEDALLVVSELTTNAVRHARGPQGEPTRCAVVVRVDADGVFVCVHDGDRRPPEVRAESLDEVGGRGLLLVESLSRRWGCSYPTPGSGKAVWAQIGYPGHRPPNAVT